MNVVAVAESHLGLEDTAGEDKSKTDPYGKKYNLTSCNLATIAVRKREIIPVLLFPRIPHKSQHTVH